MFPPNLVAATFNQYKTVLILPENANATVAAGTIPLKPLIKNVFFAVIIKFHYQSIIFLPPPPCSRFQPMDNQGQKHRGHQHYGIGGV